MKSMRKLKRKAKLKMNERSGMANTVYSLRSISVIGSRAIVKQAQDLRGEYECIKKVSKGIFNGVENACNP
jgi:hypothetical protein